MKDLSNLNLFILFTSQLDQRFIISKGNDWHHLDSIALLVCILQAGIWNTHILICKIPTGNVADSKWWQSITFLMRYFLSRRGRLEILKIVFIYHDVPLVIISVPSGLKFEPENLNLNQDLKIGYCLVQWFAICVRKPKVPGSSPCH